MLTLMSIIIGSCTDNFTFSGYPCYLVIDNSIHQDPTLASAMSPTSPGVFCQISADEVKHQYQLTNNYGQSSAVGFIQSLLGLICVGGTNWIVSKISPDNAMF